MMQLRSLYLHQFRVYDEAFFEFGPSFNIIHGPNAQGKTSLLEAIHFLTTGRSFRGGRTSDLIRQGAAHFYLEARFQKHGIEQVLRATCTPTEKKFVYNNTLLSGTAHLLGLLQGVVAAPDDVALIKGAPLVRRQYLDIQIAQADPLYVHHLSRYTRALRQRNCLLRAKQALTIESWEYEMAASASYLTRQREKAVKELQTALTEVYRKLTGSREVLEIAYKTTADQTALEEYYLNQYRKCRKREMELGATLYGPHKDDLLILINGGDVRTFASEGQQRTCVSALRCAEWERLNVLSDEKPLMLVDDAGIGLDASRCKLLMGYLSALSQVFLTSTSPGIIEGCSVDVHAIAVK